MNTSIMQMQIQKTIQSLKGNRMEGFFVPSKEDVVPKVRELLHPGDTVGVGGSVTLAETGVLSLLRNGEYHFLDRYAPGLDEERIRRIFIDSFSADAYLCSANAVTMQGELYNVDGNSNRVAAIAFGPRSVIVVAGCNKIVPDLDAAVRYVKQTAAPSNAMRLNCRTYCAAAGVCQGLEDSRMTAGCGGEERICCNYLVSARQENAGRIKVILVGEPLGY